MRFVNFIKYKTNPIALIPNFQKKRTGQIRVGQFNVWNAWK
jgi:hypothetical protein